MSGLKFSCFNYLIGLLSSGRKGNKKVTHVHEIVIFKVKNITLKPCENIDLMHICKPL